MTTLSSYAIVYAVLYPHGLYSLLEFEIKSVLFCENEPVTRGVDK